MGGQGERQKRVDIADKKDVKTENEEQRPTYPIFDYWLFTDQKDGRRTRFGYKV